MSKKKTDRSLVKKLNLRLNLRLVGIFLLLDGVLAAMMALQLWLLRGLGALRAMGVFAGVVLGVETLVVLVNGLCNHRLIRRSLQPLTELSAAAAQLSQKPAGPELSRLSAQLGRIDAGRLDTRLPLTGPAELRELTQAINSLLERLDAAYAAQIRFVSDASHELRTPIAVIQGYASLLDRWGKDDPAARQEAIDAISAEAQSMKTLTEQLLFLARGDNHTAKVHMEPVDATELAAQVLKETAMLDQTHPLSADWADAVPITADPDLVKEALRVLVDNAVKYTPAGGPIVLAVRQTGQEVRLSVTDRGQGMEKSDLPRIFERFYRADASRARQTGGSGLGLSIALWIAKCHGGHIEVRSCPHLGSRFTLILPRNPGAPPT